MTTTVGTPFTGGGGALTKGACDRSINTHAHAAAPPAHTIIVMKPRTMPTVAIRKPRRFARSDAISWRAAQPTAIATMEPKGPSKKGASTEPTARPDQRGLGPRGGGTR